MQTLVGPIRTDDGRSWEEKGVVVGRGGNWQCMYGECTCWPKPEVVICYTAISMREPETNYREDQHEYTPPLCRRFTLYELVSK